MRGVFFFFLIHIYSVYIYTHTEAIARARNIGARNGNGPWLCVCVFRVESLKLDYTSSLYIYRVTQPTNPLRAHTHAYIYIDALSDSHSALYQKTATSERETRRRPQKSKLNASEKITHLHSFLCYTYVCSLSLVCMLFFLRSPRVKALGARAEKSEGTLCVNYSVCAAQEFRHILSSSASCLHFQKFFFSLAYKKIYLECTCRQQKRKKAHKKKSKEKKKFPTFLISPTN